MLNRSLSSHHHPDPMSLLRTFRVAAAFGLGALTVPAALAVDCTNNQFIQQDVDFGAPQTHGNAGTIEVGQSFTAPCDGAAGAFTFFFTGQPGTAGQFVEMQGRIYAGTDPNTWTLLHTDLPRIKPVPGPGVVQDFFVLLGNVALVEGQQYTILIDTTPASANFQNPDVFAQWSNTDRYAGGSIFFDTPFGTFASGGDLRFSVSFLPPSAVPVELTAFDAVVDGPEVVLSWETASETNNAGFDVEVQSGDAADWTRLAFVDGYGTTSAAQRYEHRAGGLAAGAHRFRLRQVDYDGTAEYLPEVEVSLAMAGTHRLAAWPNPMTDAGRVRLDVARAQDVTVTVYDALGREVAVLFAGPASADRLVEAAMPSGLPAGLYLVRATGEAFRQAVRVTVVR